MTDANTTMRAIDIGRPGGPEVLVPVEVARPTPGPGEVLIAVAAAGVNRPDILQRQGVYPPPPGRLADPRPGGRRHHRRARPRRRPLACRRSRDGAGGGRRLRRVLRRARGLGAAVAGRPHLRRGRRAAGDVLHRVVECLRPRRPEAGRDAAGAWRRLRHRRRRHPARQGLRRHRDRHGRHVRQMRPLRGAWRRPGGELPRRGLRRRRQGDDQRARRERHPRHGRRQLCRPQLRGRGDRGPHRPESPSCRARRSMSTCSASC